MEVMHQNKNIKTVK